MRKRFGLVWWHGSKRETWFWKEYRSPPKHLEHWKTQGYRVLLEDLQLDEVVNTNFSLRDHAWWAEAKLKHAKRSKALALWVPDQPSPELRRQVKLLDAQGRVERAQECIRRWSAKSRLAGTKLKRYRSELLRWQKRIQKIKQA